MYCKKCGKEIDEDSVFCSYCGAQQSAKLLVESQVNLKSSIATDIPPVKSRNADNSKPESNSQDVNISISFRKPDFKKYESNKKSKYDYSYKKESEATVVGILLMIVNLLLILLVRFEDEYFQQMVAAIFALLSLVLRILITIWCVNIARRQNRNSGGWGVFAFFTPTLALVIIGLLRKLCKEIPKTNTRLEHEQNQGQANNIIVDTVDSKSDDYLDIGFEDFITLEGVDNDQNKLAKIGYIVTSFENVTSFWNSGRKDITIKFSDEKIGKLYFSESYSKYYIKRRNGYWQYYYKNKKAAIKALYIYLHFNQITDEGQVFSA